MRRDLYLALQSYNFCYLNTTPSPFEWVFIVSISASISRYPISACVPAISLSVSASIGNTHWIAEKMDMTGVRWVILHSSKSFAIVQIWVNYSLDKLFLYDKSNFQTIRNRIGSCILDNKKPDIKEWGYMWVNFKSWGRQIAFIYFYFWPMPLICPDAQLISVYNIDATLWNWIFLITPISCFNQI